MKSSTRAAKNIREAISPQSTFPATSEFDFRYSNRSALGIEDVKRRTLAIKGASV
jgi:hypothetical protein